MKDTSRNGAGMHGVKLEDIGKNGVKLELATLP